MVVVMRQRWLSLSPLVLTALQGGAACTGVMDGGAGQKSASSSCGNDKAHGIEECDGTDLRGRTCADLGFTGGVLACHAECVYDLRGCSTCGDEVEPGDDPFRPTDFQALAVGGEVCGSLGTGDELDVYAVSVPEGVTATVDARVHDGCATRLEIVDAAGRVTESPRLPGICPRALASSLPPGRVLVRVLRDGDGAASLAYRLALEVSTAHCGDEIQDPGQDCDDGNAASDDGCSPLCRRERPADREPNDRATKDLPRLVPPFTVDGAIDFAGDCDVHVVDVPDYSELTFELFGVGCEQADATLCFSVGRSCVEAGVPGVPIQLAGGCAVSVPILIPQMSLLVNVCGRGAAYPYQLRVDYGSRCGDGVTEGQELCDGGDDCPGHCGYPPSCGFFGPCQLPPVCGNDLVETGEACDPGFAGTSLCCDSACSETAGPGCAIEATPNDSREEAAEHRIAPAPAFPGELELSGTVGGRDVDWIALEVPGRAVLVLDDPDPGWLSCGLYPVDGWAHPDGCTTLSEPLLPGLYFVRLEQVPFPMVPERQRYSVRVRYLSVCGNGELEPWEDCDGGEGCTDRCTLPAVCGNGVREGTEECDDGNDDPTDWCAYCLFGLGAPPQPGQVMETERNDGGLRIHGNDFSAARANGPFADAVEIHAAIWPPGDDDGFAIAAPPGRPVLVEVTDESGGCADLDTRLWLRDAAGQPLAFDDDGGQGGCSKLEYGGGGMIYAHVQEGHDDGPVAAYRLRITFGEVTP
jgi:cysteine-rich repeat protein